MKFPLDRSALLFAQSAPKPAAHAGHQVTKDLPNAGKLSKAQKIALAMSAGPLAIAKDATIVDMTDMANPVTLREGTNGWACYAMLQAPMCADAVWQKWAAAWMSKMDLTTDQPGTAYMLRCDHGASNTDPYPTDWRGGGPWVMWKGTPYAHIMLPVAAKDAAK